MSKPKARSRSRRRAPQPAPSRRRLPIGIIAGVVAAGAVIAVMVLSFGGSSSALEVGSPQIEGNALPAFAAGQADPAIGLPAPTVRGTDFDGNAVAIAPGEATAILFLAHWCSHCQAEVPAVQEWLDGGGGVPGASLVSVSTAVDRLRDGYPPSQWLDEEGWTVPVVMDDEAGSAHRAYGGAGFPYWVFVDRDGNVAARWAGELSIPQLAELLAAIAA